MPETKARVHGRKRKNASAHRTKMNPSMHQKRKGMFSYQKRKSLFAYRKRRIWVSKRDDPDFVSEPGVCVCAGDEDGPVYIPEPNETVCISAEGGYDSAPQPDTWACVPETETAPCRGIRPIDADFLRHMSQYIGMTVTVYTASGGESGCGVTGVLIVCADSYVRLLTQPASAPERPQGLCRTCPFYPICSARKTQRPQGASLGAMVDIPVEHITIFVHSAVFGDTTRYNT